MYFDGKDNSDTDFQIETLDLKRLKQDININEGVQIISKYFDVNKGIVSYERNGSSNEKLSFTILTEDILSVETDSSKTYSFLIENPTVETSLFENFVMEKKQDGTFKYYFFRYIQNPDETEEVPYTLSIQELSEKQINLNTIFNSTDRTIKIGNVCIEAVCIASPRDFECDLVVTGIYDCGGGGSSGSGSGGSGSGGTGSGSGDGGGSGSGSGGSGSGGTGSGSGDGGGAGGSGSGGSDGASGSAGGEGEGEDDVPVVVINDRMPPEFVIIECLDSNGGLTEERESMLVEWLTTATYDEKKFAKNYLNGLAYGEESISFDNKSNCESESGQDFFFEGLKAELNGGEFDIANKIILDSSFVENETLKCVYDKLVKDNSSLFKQTVGAFIDDPEFNLTFKIGECVRTDDQCTDDTNPYNIIITFEDVNLSPVGMAAALLHESIHAELARFVELYLNGADVNNRPQLFDHYTHYAALYGEYSGNIDHIYMTQKYIIPICEALRRFDNNNYSQIYYTSFAWDGLRFWDALKLLETDPLADEYDAYKLIVNEYSTVCE